MSGAQTRGRLNQATVHLLQSSQVPYAMCATLVSTYGYKASWSDDGIVSGLLEVLLWIHFAINPSYDQGPSAGVGLGSRPNLHVSCDR